VSSHKSLFTENSVATQKQYNTGINTNKIQNTTIKSITSSFFTKLNYLLHLITKFAKAIHFGNISYYKLILFLRSQLGRSVAKYPHNWLTRWRQAASGTARRANVVFSSASGLVCLCVKGPHTRRHHFAAWSRHGNIKWHDKVGRQNRRCETALSRSHREDTLSMSR